MQMIFNFLCSSQGIFSGITAIVLSKNKKNRILVNTAPLLVLSHFVSC